MTEDNMHKLFHRARRFAPILFSNLVTAVWVAAVGMAIIVAIVGVLDLLLRLLHSFSETYGSVAAGILLIAIVIFGIAVVAGIANAKNEYDDRYKSKDKDDAAD